MQCEVSSYDGFCARLVVVSFTSSSSALVSYYLILELIEHFLEPAIRAGDHLLELHPPRRVLPLRWARQHITDLNEL